MSRECFMQFKVSATDGKARRGEMQFPRGKVQTPAFMPVGTYGTVKGMLPRDIVEIGAEMILGNTFHLMLRPGTEVVKAHGDLHDFTQWQGPILTDSGGFQVFSLGDMSKITEEGVKFKSPIDCSPVFIDPETSIEVQRDLGEKVENLGNKAVALVKAEQLVEQRENEITKLSEQEASLNDSHKSLELSHIHN